MKRILVTGSSRGLGLEFVKQLLEKGNQIIACNRNPLKYPDLLELKNKFEDKLVLIDLDVSSKDSIDNAFTLISKEIDGLDILINNAGIRFGGEEKYCDELGKLYKEDFGKIFTVNSVAPVLIVEKFLPLIKNGRDPVIVNISSTSGSIGRRSRKGGGYSYSASKAALNMITKALSVDLHEEGITVVSIHPGWVKTTMEYTENAPLTTYESIKGMRKVIDTLSIEKTGKFFDWEGNDLPW
ncbi:MAG: SDR family oxidoreductase [Candidatus Heimdallarchaeota archaeon]|nr:SDR family oxidoreductase [Candidatus Heimdallarchaeota archaeon]MCG3255688.1 SDR family oxidoreductase [Candidatus Heimdallarchaeota archaeon]MCK4610762.1 SDR family oxidoreductase [Candidatus Heimdallarchaeota archaeon]